MEKFYLEQFIKIFMIITLNLFFISKVMIEMTILIQI